MAEVVVPTNIIYMFQARLQLGQGNGVPMGLKRIMLIIIGMFGSLTTLAAMTQL